MVTDSSTGETTRTDRVPRRMQQRGCLDSVGNFNIPYVVRKVGSDIHSPVVACLSVLCYRPRQTGLLLSRSNPTWPTAALLSRTITF